MWINNIYRMSGVKVTFPVIADRSGEIARKYGMISNNINSTAAVRSVIVIDDKGVIKMVSYYPLEVERNVYEILRVIKEFDPNCPVPIGS